MGKLDHQVAVITGAASGMGAAIARLFLDEGARVVLLDLGDVPEDLAALETVSAHRVDVTDAESMKQVMNRTADEQGRLDILVNAAGIVDEVSFLEMSPERFDKMINVDLRGVFLGARFAAPHMVKAGHGRIINFSSQTAIKGDVGLAHYIAAKAGVIGLTKAMATELAPHNVLVNAIAPGPVTTPMFDAMPQEFKDNKANRLPLGRFGRPEEVAPTALLLASSPDGNIYVGQTLGPNSGDVMP